MAYSTCHRLVPPAAIPGEAAGDAAERAALTGPFITGNSAYLVDRNDVRCGPFTIAAAVRVEGAQVTLSLANTLISGSSVALEAKNNAQPPKLSYSSVLIDNNVSTVISGTINATGTPLRGAAGYVNAAAGDYHFTAASNAIDKGNGLAPLVDLDGASRPKGATTEIGAYEFTPANLNNQAITFGPLADKLCPAVYRQRHGVVRLAGELCVAHAEHLHRQRR